MGLIGGLLGKGSLTAQNMDKIAAILRGEQLEPVADEVESPTTMPAEAASTQVVAKAEKPEAQKVSLHEQQIRSERLLI